MISTIEEALSDLRKGKLIIVCDDEDRENEGDFVGIAEVITAEQINFMAKFGRGLICAPISADFAAKLDLNLATKQNVGTNDTNFTDSVDHVSVTTGISAYERAVSIQKLVSSDAAPSDFRRPGHIFPLISKDGGVLVRAGHTEAATDLARMAGFKEGGVICEIMSDDGSMARMPELIEIAARHDLKIVTIKDLIEYRLLNDSLIKREIEIDLPTDFGAFRLYGYSTTVDNHLHLAIVKGDLTSFDSTPTLVRVHSECLTGDVFMSCRCDCGPQLEKSLSIIDENKSGVLLYMRQEGRGIGLLNKLKAYKLQEEGFDTVEANLKLGFPDDLRDYGIGAQILRDLGVKSIDLLTNNPRKIVGLEAYGLKVSSRRPIEVPSNQDNLRYLHTKKSKLGHLLDNL